MAFNRVMNFIRCNTKTIVYVVNGVVHCSNHQSKAAPTILNEAKKARRPRKLNYQVVGVYLQDIDEAVVAQDLDVCGVKE